MQHRSEPGEKQMFSFIVAKTDDTTPKSGMSRAGIPFEHGMFLCQDVSMVTASMQ